MDEIFREGLGHGLTFGYFALSGLGSFSGRLSQGVALGWIIAPRWGNASLSAVVRSSPTVKGVLNGDRRHTASNNISSASKTANAPASCGQSDRVLPASSKSSSSRTTVTVAPVPLSR